MAPIVLYGQDHSAPCRAVMVTAKIVGAELEIKSIDHIKNEHLTESFLKVNPAHTIPAIDDNGFIIWESRVIMAYLVQHYAEDDKLHELYPKDPKERAIVDNMLHFDNGTFFILVLLQILPIHILLTEPPSENMEKIKDRLNVIDMILSRSKFAAGDKVTIADICMLTTLSLAVALKHDMNSYPNIARYLAETPSKIPHYEEVNNEGENKMKALIDKLLQRIK